MKNKTVLIGLFMTILLAPLFSSCGQRKNKIGGADEKTAIQVQSPAQQFTVPDMPLYIQEPQAQRDFIVSHFWDNLDCSDTTMISQNPRAIAEWVSFLSQVPVPKAHEAILQLLKKSEQNGEVTRFFLEKLNLFLMDPNSPIRNDELYEPVCKYILETADGLDPRRFQAELDLKFIGMNRRGSVAHDFMAMDANGRQVRLHQIKSPYTFVVFYNPDCHGCEENMNYIKASAVLNSEPVKALMKVIAVYVDQSPEIWERAKEMIPVDWVSLWDKSGKLRQDEIYDLKAIPTLYLLDQDKKVILKDANLPDVENYFVQMLGMQ